MKISSILMDKVSGDYYEVKTLGKLELNNELVDVIIYVENTSFIGPDKRVTYVHCLDQVSEKFFTEESFTQYGFTPIEVCNYLSITIFQAKIIYWFILKAKFNKNAIDYAEMDERMGTSFIQLDASVEDVIKYFGLEGLHEDKLKPFKWDSKLYENGRKYINGFDLGADFCEDLFTIFNKEDGKHSAEQLRDSYLFPIIVQYNTGQDYNFELLKVKSYTIEFLKEAFGGLKKYFLKDYLVKFFEDNTKGNSKMLRDIVKAIIDSSQG